MLIRLMFGCAVLLAGSLSTRADLQAAMNGDELRSMVTQNRVFLATPLGGEFPLNYRPNGQVDGSGEALGLGRFVQPKDKGRWWISGNSLCQQWETWYDGKRMCFVIQRNGANRFSWQQDNGDKGTGRIAPR